MDSNSVDYHILDQDNSPYKVTYRHPQGMDHNKNEDPTKKRSAASRSGPSPGRVKRVVSCKRKTHHLTVARKKQPAPGKPHVASNKENEMKCGAGLEEQQIFHMDPWDLPQDKHRTGRTGPEPLDYSLLSEMRRDHCSLINVLFGRNLRLKVAFTLWQRNVGELLTYFLRLQDCGVFVDFLPVITKSISENTKDITIGCCVDLFPLVKKVLSNPYEEYVTVGLKWIDSVVRNWSQELRESGLSGSSKASLDKNFQIFNQQLLELWHHDYPRLKSAPGSAGDLAKAIDAFIAQLPW